MWRAQHQVQYFVLGWSSLIETWHGVVECLLGALRSNTSKLFSQKVYITASDLGASNRDQQKPRHGGLLLETARSLARWMMRFARITESHGLSLAKAAERTLKGGFGVHLGSKFFDEMTRQKSYPMWALHWLILKFFAGVILISEVACHINILFETHSLLFWMASLFVATNPCPDISTAGLHWSGRSSRVRV